MGFWNDRKQLKHARELVAGTRKLLRMHRDILDPKRIQEITVAVDGLASVIDTKNVSALDAARERLEKQLDKTFPRPHHAGLHENAEVLLVALIVAMAVRTFFVQPFKIPTGSMQPTLYGVYPGRPPESQYQPPMPYINDLSSPPGRSPGVVAQLASLRENPLGEHPPQLERPSLIVRLLGMTLFGVIFESDGYRIRGDHIFVDRFSYHFRPPQRGEVVVFATQFMRERGFDPRGGFYIKRAVARGGDHVEIVPPYLRVNGEIPDLPAFQRMYAKKNGYGGYTLPDLFTARFINNRHPSNDVPPNSWLVFGDNSTSSLDSRFWGPVPRSAIVGRAVFVYWPFTKRLGLIE
jgi:signal peptidase I